MAASPPPATKPDTTMALEARVETRTGDQAALGEQHHG
jgi:hypothetical protein